MSRASNQPILTCRDLSVGYKDKPVLTDINLNLEAGHFISLLGPNGAGKTTLLRTLSRHLDPLSGCIEIQGRPLSTLNTMEMARIMAVVLTDKIAPPLFTVYEFVSLGRYPHTDFLGRLAPDDHNVVQHALSAVHAGNLARRIFTDLSDGERQKVLVARALAQQPRLLLLDEPTLHLDLKHRVEVMGILRNLCRNNNITVVASLHDVDVAAKVSDSVVLIKSGTVTGWGPPETVLESRTVAELYDFDGADFDHHLGGIELRSSGDSGRAFVVAGMGSGAVIYRMLAKRGFTIATGVLHTNDLDYYVARSLGIQCTTQSPMDAIDDTRLALSCQQLDGCNVIIDCGFHVGPMNQGNVKLLEAALKKGKTVLTLRNNGEKIFPDDPALFPDASIIRCNDATRLLEELDRRFSGNGHSHLSDTYSIEMEA